MLTIEHVLLHDNNVVAGVRGVLLRDLYLRMRGEDAH
jgi:hypothetical protein